MVATVSARVGEPGHEYYHLNPALLSTTRLLPRILTSTVPPGSSCASSSSCSSSPATTHTSADSWHPKPDSPEPEPEPQPKHKEPQVPRRKKASRACGHCQKAHLTCDDGRPCKRCEKRGLATSCADGARKKAKYLCDYDDALVARPRSGKRIGAEYTVEDVCKKVKLEPEEQECTLGITWADDDLLDQLGICQWSGAEEEALGVGPVGAATGSEEWAFGQLESGLEEWLEAFEGSGSRNSSAGLRNIGTNPSKVPNEVTRASESQRRMENWVERIVRSIEIKKLTMNITADDEWMLKRNLDRSLMELERLMALSGTPTMVWSALGEILRVGDEFCMLSDWSREELIGRHIEEVFEPESLEEYMDLVEKSLFADEDGENYPANPLARHAGGIPGDSMSQTRSESHDPAIGRSDLGATQMMKWCRIRKPRGQQSIGCSFCFRICRDTFDCPSYAVGNFLPILTCNSFSN